MKTKNKTLFDEFTFAIDHQAMFCGIYFCRSSKTASFCGIYFYILLVNPQKLIPH